MNWKFLAVSLFLFLWHLPVWQEVQNHQYLCNGAARNDIICAKRYITPPPLHTEGIHGWTHDNLRVWSNLRFNNGNMIWMEPTRENDRLAFSDEASKALLERERPDWFILLWAFRNHITIIAERSSLRRGLFKLALFLFGIILLYVGSRSQRTEEKEENTKCP